jgi:hypothetical protein
MIDVGLVGESINVAEIMLKNLFLQTIDGFLTRFLPNLSEFMNNSSFLREMLLPFLTKH